MFDQIGLFIFGSVKCCQIAVLKVCNGKTGMENEDEEFLKKVFF